MSMRVQAAETPDHTEEKDRQQQLVDGALQTDDQNNEAFLTRLAERLSRSAKLAHANDIAEAP